MGAGYAGKGLRKELSIISTPVAVVDQRIKAQANRPAARGQFGERFEAARDGGRAVFKGLCYRIGRQAKGDDAIF